MSLQAFGGLNLIEFQWESLALAYCNDGANINTRRNLQEGKVGPSAKTV